MIGQMRKGEDIEYYADKYEERQRVMKQLAEEEEKSPTDDKE